MTDIHNFDAVSGAYIHTSPARLDPLDGLPLVPANATMIAPPAAPPGQVVRWTGAAWELVADQRGTEYWLPDGSHHTITEIGVERPPEALDAPPPPSLDARRAGASLDRSGFCVALNAQGILAVADAISAAKGDWPSAFGEAPAALMIDWAAKQQIGRTGPVVTALIAANALTETQADALFEV